MGDQPSFSGWLARRGTLGFFGAAISAVLGFITTWLIARLLGTEGAGVVMQATAIFAVVVALSKVGMDSTAIFLLPRLRIDSPERISHHLMLFGAVAFGVSALAAVALNAAADWLWGQAGEALPRAIAAIAWFLPAQAMLLVSSAALRALGGMRSFVLTQNIALPLLRPAVIVLAVSAVSSAMVVAVAWAAPIVLVLVISLVLLVRKVMALPRAEGTWPSREEGVRVLQFAAPRTMAAGLEQAIVWLDILIVGALVGNAAAGIYGGASRFIQAGMIVDTALRVVVSPRISALVHERRTSDLVRLHTTATVWLVLFASPVYVLMGVFAPTLMSLLGEDFVPGAAVLVALSVAAGVTFLAGNIHTLLLMSGHSGWAAANKVVVLVVNVVGNLLLVPVWGILGAAVAWAVCMILDAVLATIEVRIFLRVMLAPSVFVVPLAVVAITVAAPAVVVALTTGQGYAQLAVAAAVSLVLFSGGCFLLRERLHLRNLKRN